MNTGQIVPELHGEEFQEQQVLSMDTLGERAAGCFFLLWMWGSDGFALRKECLGLSQW